MQKFICQYCGKEIKFIKTKNGKSMPVNPGMIPYLAVKGGPEKIMTRDGEVVSCITEDTNYHYSGVGYVPHWATCPAAKIVKTANKEEKIGIKVEEPSLF